MRIYYRGQDAYVTGEHFVWRTSPPKVFEIRELQNVVMVRGDLDPIRPTTAHVAGASMVVVAASWPLLDSMTAYAVAALALVVPGLVTAACRRMRPRCWELRATYQGQVTLLYASSDVRAYNQVTRGLRRALESSGPPSRGFVLAS